MLNFTEFKEKMASSDNRTLYVGNLSEKVTEEIIYELFLQAGPLESVRIPVQNGRRRPYGFVEFKHEISVPYAARLFHQTCLFGRMLNLQHTKQHGGRDQMHDHLMIQQMQTNSPIMSRLGPPIFVNDYYPIALLPPATAANRNHYMPKKRTATHLMPSTLNKKKTKDEVVDKHVIPDSLNFQGLIGGGDDTKPKKEEKTEEDLRTKIKKKKKKKNKEGKERTSKSDAHQQDKFTARGGSDFHNPQKSFIKNAVNQLRNYSRNHRGSYDINSRHKGPRHIHFDS